MPQAFSHYFNVAPDLHLQIDTPCPFDAQTILQLGAYLPGLAPCVNIAAPSDIKLTHLFAKRSALMDNGTEVVISTTPGDTLPADIYHLLYGMQRRAMIARNTYPVHAACVGDGDSHTLIVGHSGSGKTTLAQTMIDQHGWQLFSGNKTLIGFADDGSITALAGTTTMTALDDKLQRFAYRHDDQISPKKRVRIDHIVIARLNDGVQEKQSLSPLSALHTLYPYFMDAVNSDVIIDGRFVFDGSIPPAQKLQLTEQLADAFANTPVTKLSGSLPYLTTQVLSP